MRERVLGHGFDRGWAQCVEKVVAASGDLACDRQRRSSVSETAGFQRVVVGVVGALQARRGLRGFIERPAQRRRSLAGEFPDPAGLIRAVHADVDPGEPHRFARAGHSPDVTELGQRNQGR